MYVILINEDNTATTVKKQRIMQRSKLVDDLFFVVPPMYNGYSVSDFTFLVEFLKPVSKEYTAVTLELCEDKYEEYLKYKFPIDTELTRESGNLEIQPTFVYSDLDENGNSVQRVRKISKISVEVLPISKWADVIPDNALSALDQRLIKIDAQMKGLNEYMDAVDSNMVDNIIYNDKDDTIQLSSKGEGVGDKVSVKDMLDDGVPVVVLNSETSDTEDKDEANCQCEDVVEF